MQPQPLFEIKPYAPHNWRAHIKSVSFNEREIIQWIMRLHNGNAGFDVDLTYSIGHLWYDLPQPKYKFDLMPQAPGVIQADARAVPLACGSVGSVMFDPPFIIRGVSPHPTMAEGPRHFKNGSSNLQSKRFGGYPSEVAYLELYRAVMAECWRVLKAPGLVVVKCQDQTTSGKGFWAHLEIMNLARCAGFVMEDLFVLVSDHYMISPSEMRPKHARKIHSYFLIFRKPKARRKKNK
jgi:hypothetical protein